MDEKIMVNEEVIETVENIVPTSSINGWAVVGKASAVAGVIYCVAKAVNYFKAKKQNKEDNVVVVNNVNEEVKVSNEDDVE